jgi:hypoxanthine phosphoribosyltransferase
LKSKIARAFSADEIAARVAALGQEIRRDAGSSEVFLLGVLKGTAVFLGDLMRAIDGDVGYGFIDVIRDMADTEVASALEIDFLSHVDIAGRSVYLLKDVVSTGVIETYLLNQLRQKQPAALKLVALLDRPEQRTVELKADFTLFKAPEGSFVGYGLEHQGQFGNLPWIGRVT